MNISYVVSKSKGGVKGDVADAFKGDETNRRTIVDSTSGLEKMLGKSADVTSRVVGV